MAKPKDPAPKEPSNGPKAKADIVKLHREYLERRLKGGAPATPQAYARAMAQWQRLPGAVPNLPATDLAQAQQALTPNEVSALTPGSDTRKKEQES